MLRTIQLAGAALACGAGLASCGDVTEVDTPAVTDIAGSPGVTAPIGNPETARNNTLITLSGTVTAAGPHSFTLDYGSGNIAVEMDDWDPSPEGGTIKVGDSVVVSGLVDQDLSEKRKIEARSVLVPSLSAYFYANAADEEIEPGSLAPRSTRFSDATGLVTAVEGRELTIGSGPTAVRVDTARMADNPLDDAGTGKIGIGDRVYAYGELDIDPKEQAEIMADGLVRMVSAGNPRPLGKRESGKAAQSNKNSS